MSLRILADENIPQVAEAFAGLGSLRTMAGRAMSRADTCDADLLIVRSVTAVNEELLGGTPVRFVGTATIGTDHLDLNWLHAAGITVASAQGSNAQSVVEYVVAAMLTLEARGKARLQGATLGIVGHGNIGSRLARVAPSLGMKVVACDPPLQRGRVPGPWLNLEGLLRCADIVSLHVPLIRDGMDRTVALIGEEQLGWMKAGAVLINSSRGNVVVGSALLAALKSGTPGAAVLDVFEGEPDVERELVRALDIATPHIAGYSTDGKLNGTWMIAREASRFARRDCCWKPALPEPADPQVRFDGVASAETVRAAVRRSYDIEADDRALRDGLALPQGEWPRHFDALRRNYPVRREFAAWSLRAEDVPLWAAETLRHLGFCVV